jgi:hypothetical protein
MTHTPLGFLDSTIRIGYFIRVLGIVVHNIINIQQTRYVLSGFKQLPLYIFPVAEIYGNIRNVTKNTDGIIMR